MAENSPARRICSSMCRLFRALWAWLVKSIKTKFLESRRCRAQREMDKRVKRLGAEIYSLHKQGETEFIKSQIVQQHLKLAEEAESRLFEIYDRIEAIDNNYRRKKQEIAESGRKEEKLLCASP